MRPVNCPSCYHPIGNIMEEIDIPVYAERFGMSEQELEQAMDAERPADLSYVCERCGTPFIPAEQGWVAS